MEAALDRFRAAGTQVLGVSVDSVHSHANWASDLGGVSFPLLADFHPKGALAQSLGLYLDEAGISDRATVIADRDGIVRYAVSVGPGGKRDVDELVQACEGVGGGSASFQPSPVDGAQLFVKSQCGPSRNARLAVANLHLADAVRVCNVTDDAAAAAELEGLGKNQAPCLKIGDEVLFESADIVRALADRAAPLNG